MADWKAYKGQGSWDFVEQVNKWGYLNNPRWSSQPDVQEFCEAVELNLDTTFHIPCGHWHKGRLPAYAPYTGGRWIAAKDQPGKPYIYLYDVTLKATVKIDTSQDGCPLVEYLGVNSGDWILGYARDYPSRHYNGTQRGGCCMSKNGNILWYLFEGSGDNEGDLKLVEVNISEDTMSVVDTTIFRSIIDISANITDGCTDDYYTFWSTDKLSGQIIKIKNSDHSLIEVHNFNTLDAMEPIRSLDVDKDNSRLYWSYVRSCGGVPLCNAFANHEEGDLDFNILNEVTWKSFGAGTPQFQNIVRFYEDEIYFDRIYYTTSGYLRRRNPGFILNTGNSGLAPYNRNILNVKDGYVFCLHINGTTSDVTYISKIIRFTMTLHDRIDVKYYAGTGYLLSYPWFGTACSAMNKLTGKIMMFRYEVAGRTGTEGTGIASRNWGAAWNTNLELLSDTPYDEILIPVNTEGGRNAEPQVWPMEF